MGTLQRFAGTPTRPVGPSAALIGQSGRLPDGSSSIGRAPVSKTGGWGFESLLPCQLQQFGHGTCGHPADPSSREFTVTTQAGDEVAVTGGATPAPRGPARRLGLFYRQVVAELRKVVYPSRDELIRYTGVVLAFVVVVIAYVSLVDYGLRALVLRVFT
jgi:preprotein translocase subunit SecE